MKLWNLVDIIDNNIDCVVLKVKDDARLDLIKLGYFTGNEDIIRLTKGENHTCSIFSKDGGNFNWYWGKSGYTLVSDEMKKKGKLIEECITEDFDIYIGDNIDNIKNSLYIHSLDDVKTAQHFIEFCIGIEKMLIFVFIKMVNIITILKQLNLQKNILIIWDLLLLRKVIILQRQDV